MTYKDLKIGQELICIKVTDLDFHFPNSVCVKLKGPWYFHQEFVPIECFSDISVRDQKLTDLGI